MVRRWNLEYVRIAGLERQVSRIGLGTWSMGGGWWSEVDDATAVATLLEALDRGINLIDTAPIYGFGRSEEIVGKALAQFGRRDEVVIATKCGLEWGPGGAWRNASRSRILEEVEGSLRRLGTDYLDIYQIHWPDPLTPAQESAEAMYELYRSGKIRAIGVSNYSVAEMEDFRKFAPLYTAQPPYNIFERQIEEDVLPYCREHGIATLVYSPLCRGLLSGKYTLDTRFDDYVRVHLDPKFRQPYYGEYLAAVAELDRLARERYGLRVVHLAMRWVLDRPGVSVALWGARRRDQLEPLEGMMGWHLTERDMLDIDAIVGRHVHTPVGPEYMAPPLRARS
jgi:aryl-alcohol dehydrogenase-like predicted oxidoreductase